MVLCTFNCFSFFQGKLELLTGGNRSTMRLEVYDKNNQIVCKPDDGSRLLGFYPIDDGMRLHVRPFNLRILLG